MVATRIWVVSLADATARRQAFADSVGETDLDWAFFDAHRSLEPPLTFDPDEVRIRCGRDLTPGEFGCYSSHHALWRWLAASDVDQMMVLEDDVVLDWRFLARLAGEDFAAAGIDYIRLFAKVPPRMRYVKSPYIDRYHHLVQITSYALGTQGYLITRSGAKRLLSLGNTVNAPVDVVLDRYWEHGIPNLAIYPFPLFERFQPSSIGDHRLETQPVPRSVRLRYLGWKVWERLIRAREALLPRRGTWRKPGV